MTEETLHSILRETRREHGIPPFFEDEDLTSVLREGVYRITKLVGAEIDYTTDLKARSILKVFAFYAFNQKVDEFYINYAQDLLSLQFDYVPTEIA